ncbi:N-alpha-acetyltransferase 80 isoform X2 [Thrips palmi]|uniref:N-alpha-acetyltransferase 80 isoform X2 n=1 Tax=Thrips palmi TaxID=161013 RepID=A0A6P8YYC2_THRPL|nr:N-alpha-acetyltransferase 80 isoform X2 [Thrips palmi]
MPQPPPKLLPPDPENPCVLVPLHQYPEFTLACATLLNMEWPRSQQARLNSLSSCSDNFPVGMVLVQSNSRQALGFCKVSLIPNLKDACFVESVHPQNRGEGLGSLLMKKLEEYVISRNLHIVYLSTLGQEKFYKKLGYNECEPVSLYSFGLRSISSGPKDSKTKNMETETCRTMIDRKIAEVNKEMKCLLTGPPPPPPPLPKQPIGHNVMSVKTYMKKELAKPWDSKD